MEQDKVEEPEIIAHAEEQQSLAPISRIFAKVDENSEEPTILLKTEEQNTNENDDTVTVSSSSSSESDEEIIKEDLEELKQELKEQNAHHLYAQKHSSDGENDDINASANRVNELRHESKTLLDNLKEEEEKNKENQIELETLKNTIHNMERPDLMDKDTNNDLEQFKPTPMSRKISHENNNLANERGDDRKDFDTNKEENLIHNTSEEETTKDDSKSTNGISGDIDQLLIQLRVMSQENESLRDVIRNLRYNYDRAIATLKDVETSFSQRDVMIAYYKQELEVASKGNNNDKHTPTEAKEGTNLRNGLLDTRLQLERLKSLQTSKDFQETELNERLEPIVLSLQQSQSECNELRLKVNELTDELSRARSQGEDHESAEKDIKENELIIPLKEQVTSLEKDLDNITTKLKVKDTKYKYTKKEVERLQNELNDSKVSAQNFPNLLLEVESLTVKNEELKHQLEEMYKNEANRLQNEEAQKQREAAQRQLEKDAWEKRIVLNNEKLYEIVQQSENKTSSEDDMERPLSAPHSKVSHSSEPSRRLVNGRRLFHGKGNSLPSSIINPEYINSYPEAIRATQRIQRRQQLQHAKEIDLRERKLHRSRTQPLTTKSRSAKVPMINTSPKVLLYDSHGEREGKRLLAKGDLVMINTALPNENGDKSGSHLFDVSGVVHYIGPLNEEDSEIYIGIVLNEPVGDHDGKIDGRRYFKCQAPYGKLVKLIDIISILKHGGVTHNATL